MATLCWDTSAIAVLRQAVRQLAQSSGMDCSGATKIPSVLPAMVQEDYV